MKALKISLKVAAIHTLLTVLFLLCIFPQTTLAQNSCQDLLARTTNTAENLLYAPVKRPLVGNTINPEGLAAWVEAHRQFGPEFLELAQFISESITIYTQQEFEQLLTSAVTQFLATLQKDQKYFLVVTEPISKGQFWVARIINELMFKRAPETIMIMPDDTQINSYLIQNTDQVPLFIDDALYTGMSMEEGIRTYFSNATFNNHGINIVVAATTTTAKQDIARSLNANIFYGTVMPSVKELLEKITDPERKNRLTNAFKQQYFDYAIDLPITGFAHKTADQASIPGIHTDEDYRYTPVENSATTILEGALLGPDEYLRDTIPILNTERKPY